VDTGVLNVAGLVDKARGLAATLPSTLQALHETGSLVPKGRVDNADIGHDDIGRIADREWDRARKCPGRTAGHPSIGVERLVVPPYLSASVDGASTVERDAVSSEEPVRGGILL